VSLKGGFPEGGCRESVKGYRPTCEGCQAAPALLYNLVEAVLVQCIDAVSTAASEGGGGNWDRIATMEMASRLGLQLRISAQVDVGVNRHFRNEKGPLEFDAAASTSSLRNLLIAHCYRYAFVSSNPSPSQLTS
jgi:hypothetical protein